jgi:hypothetical protein
VVTGLKHQMEKRSMEYFAGLDVSVKDTSVYIVDGTGTAVGGKADTPPHSITSSWAKSVRQCGKLNRADGPATPIARRNVAR